MRVVGEFQHLFFRIRDRSRLPNLYQGDRWPISCGQRRQPASGRSSAEVEQPLHRRALTQGKSRNRKQNCWVILFLSLHLCVSLIHSLSVCYRALFKGAFRCTRGFVNMSFIYLLINLLSGARLSRFRYLLSSSLLIIVSRILFSNY